jgi:thymidylate kinase
MKGKIVVIEGGDSAGKATQTALLHERLTQEGYQVERMAFPRYSENQMGSLIRECLDGKHGDFIGEEPRVVATLYAVDRRESLLEITSWLHEGKIVILDRYTSANMLHQAAKHKDEAKCKEMMQWVYRLEHDILGLPVPDMILYLNVSAGKRLELLASLGRELDQAESNKKHQEEVDSAAKLMLEMYPCAAEIDCMSGNDLLSRTEIGERIYSEVRAIIES